LITIFFFFEKKKRGFNSKFDELELEVVWRVSCGIVL